MARLGRQIGLLTIKTSIWSRGYHGRIVRRIYSFNSSFDIRRRSLNETNILDLVNSGFFHPHLPAQNRRNSLFLAKIRNILLKLKKFVSDFPNILVNWENIGRNCIYCHKIPSFYHYFGIFRLFGAIFDIRRTKPYNIRIRAPFLKRHFEIL